MDVSPQKRGSDAPADLLQKVSKNPVNQALLT